METRANYVLIGVFTLAVIAGGFLFVMWFTGLGKSAQHKSYEVVFTGSVSGLSRGSLRHLQRFEGRRSAVDRFLPNDPTRVAAMIDVTENAPVKSDTKARLESQGLDRRCDAGADRGIEFGAVARAGSRRRPADHQRRALGLSKPARNRAADFRQGRRGPHQSQQAHRRQQPGGQRCAAQCRSVFEGAG